MLKIRDDLSSAHQYWTTLTRLKIVPNRVAAGATGLAPLTSTFRNGIFSVPNFPRDPKESKLFKLFPPLTMTST